MTTNFIHIICAAIWFGTAITLPFWGRRMNNADHLHTVLGIMDTVYTLKIAFIMGGLLVTLTSGALLSIQSGLPYFSFTDPYSWLGISQTISIIITINSFILLYLMTKGRKGRRSHFRYVPAIGYNNIFLLLLAYIQMTLRPALDEQLLMFIFPFAIQIIANIIFITLRFLKRQHVIKLSPQAYIQMYFKYLKEENMTELFRLFRDDAVFNDPFATSQVSGIKSIEKFFQKLGDQFESIEITPVSVKGDRNCIYTEWVANGLTKNGEEMTELRGTNKMDIIKGRIKSVNINFNLEHLPKVTRVTV